MIRVWLFLIFTFAHATNVTPIRSCGDLLNSTNVLTLNTERLELRALSLNDLDAAASVLMDPEACAASGDHLSLNEIRDYLSRSAVDPLNSPRNERNMEWGVYSHGLIVGEIGLFRNRVYIEALAPLRKFSIDPATYMLSYHFKPEAWGKGYATEALKAVLDFAYKKLSIEVIHVRILKTNSGSLRVAEKLGMTPFTKGPDDGYFYFYKLNESQPEQTQAPRPQFD